MNMSEYLRAEQPDYTQPASFYKPGIAAWGDVWRQRRTAAARTDASAAAKRERSTENDLSRFSVELALD